MCTPCVLGLVKATIYMTAVPYPLQQCVECGGIIRISKLLCRYGVVVCGYVLLNIPVCITPAVHGCVCPLLQQLLHNLRRVETREYKLRTGLCRWITLPELNR